ncbi:MAG: hypothetical protein WHT08_06955 [Bryobacteraceae bacterium]
MGLPWKRAILIAAAGAAVFALAVAAGLKLTSAPRTQADYLVIGSVATFLMLGVVFGLLLALWVKPKDFLVKRRTKGRAGENPEAR